MIWLCKTKMLVLLLLTLTSADFCEGKAFREESAKDRGRRSYAASAGLHQTYDSQSNAEHLKNFYEPRVDGQAIYIPSLDQPGSYQEFLDSYYKAYTPVRNPVTPVPLAYGTSKMYKIPETSTKAEKIVSGDYGVNYAITPLKESLSKMSMSSDYSLPESDYDSPEIIDKDIVTELQEKDYEEATLLESLKTKPGDYNQYDQPAVKTVKQKPKTDNGKKATTKKPISKTKPQVEDTDDYEKPVILKTVKVKPNKKPETSTEADKISSKTYGLNYAVTPSKESLSKMNMPDDYSLPERDDSPEVLDKAVMSESEEQDYKEPTLLESLKKLESPDSKPGDYNRYNQPAVKTVKQKPKTNNKKKPATKKPISKTKPQVEDTDDYEKPVIHKTIKVKQNKKPVTNNSKPKYGNRTNQSIRRKGKGKRRKQYSKPKIEVATGIENASGLVSETSELSKKDVYQSELYPSNDPTSEVKEKGSVRTNNPVKKENVMVNNPQYKPVKTKEDISKDKPEKTKVQRDPPYQPIKIKDKVVVNSNSKGKPIKSKEEITVKYDDSEVGQLSNRKDLIVNGMSNTDNPSPEYDFTDDLDTEENEFSERKLNPELEPENDVGSESTEASAIEKMDYFPNASDFRGLPMNSNIWSMLFNPNAQQNRLQQKRCITRSNETGFCTYIQNCEVPQIATSLEKLLNNACVIDEIFIGVCCPEFPVQTVKVHWDQTPSDFDNQIEDEFGHDIEDCGIRSNEASELQSWPWKAPLVSMSNGKIFCGGVLVSKDHVLTAAHCTTKIPKNQILVRLGQFDDESGDDYAVIEIKRHAQYNPRTMQNDVALLKLGRRINNDAHIGTVCLPEDDDDEDDHDGETATLLGWRGIFGTKSRDPEFLAVMSNEECEKKLGRKIASGSLCTETRKENERTCNADSGAPLVIKDDGKYEVIGILSWNRNDCDQRFPSTFSRVSSYTGWIKTHIS